MARISGEGASLWSCISPIFADLGPTFAKISATTHCWASHQLASSPSRALIPQHGAARGSWGLKTANARSCLLKTRRRRGDAEGGIYQVLGAFPPAIPPCTAMVVPLFKVQGVLALTPGFRTECLSGPTAANPARHARFSQRFMGHSHHVRRQITRYALAPVPLGDNWSPGPTSRWKDSSSRSLFIWAKAKPHMLTSCSSAVRNEQKASHHASQRLHRGLSFCRVARDDGAGFSLEPIAC